MAKGAYAQCVGRSLKGKLKGLNKSERKRRFCIVSKLCSSKASTEAQAANMCK